MATLPKNHRSTSQSSYFKLLPQNGKCKKLLQAQSPFQSTDRPPPSPMNPCHALPGRQLSNRIWLLSVFALALIVWAGRLRADDGIFDNLFIGGYIYETDLQPDQLGSSPLSIDSGGNLTAYGNIIGNSFTTTMISTPSYQLTSKSLSAYQDLYIQSGGATGLNLTAFDDGTNPGIVNIVAHADADGANYTSAINLAAIGAWFTSSQINLASTGWNGTISLSAWGDIDLASNNNINLASNACITVSSWTTSLSSEDIYIAGAGLSPGLLALDSSRKLVNATISGGTGGGGVIGYLSSNNTLGIGGYTSPYSSYALAVGGSAYVSNTLTATNVSISNTAYSSGVITAHRGIRVPAGGNVPMGSFTSGTSP